MSRLRANLVLAVVVVGSLTASLPAWGQTADSWSFLVTPQTWISHIPKNGFNPADPLDLQSSKAGLVKIDSSKHDDGVSPQWGLQVAAQKGRWTLSGAFQYVNFETVNDPKVAADGVFSTAPPCIPVSATQCQVASSGVLPVGFSLGKERLNTTRMDADFAATYFIPDVVKDWLDVSIGGGIKFIYATSARQFEPALLTYRYSLLPGIPAFQAPSPEFYLVCHKDDGSDCVRKDRVKTKDYFYGATIPMSLITHLSRDVLLPFSVTPFLGAETRDDQDVAYALTPDRTKIKRLDGTTFAYGGTVDATIRWLISDTLSTYVGMRVQYIKGHETFLAYGPLVGMSVRFGGR